METVTVHVCVGSDEREVAMLAVAAMDVGELRSGQPLLVPSTGRSDDQVLALVDRALREHGVPSRRFAPVTGLRSIIGGGWTTIEIELPDLPSRSVRVPNELVSASPWIVCDVDAVARTGPFVLDALARYLHPLDRLRHLADRNRDRRSAELNLGVRPGRCMVVGHATKRYLIANTRDVVAAELVALALSEYALGSNVALTGPWEDPVMQRATELELGVLVPQQITFIVHGDQEDARPVLNRIAGRIGVSSFQCHN